MKMLDYVYVYLEILCIIVSLGSVVTDSFLDECCVVWDSFGSLGCIRNDFVRILK